MQTQIRQLLLLLFLIALSVSDMWALSNSDVNITRITSPIFINDHQSACVSSINTPHAAYIGFKITNTSSVNLSYLSFNLGGFSNNPNVAPIVGLAGGQNATQLVNLLTPNQSVVLYWYVGYPCTSNVACNMSLTAQNKLPGTVTKAFSVTTQSCIGNSAGGSIKATTINSNQNSGGIISYEVKYSLISITNGDVAMLEPVGNLNFRADAFQLIDTKITATDIALFPLGSKNLTYAVSSAHYGNKEVTCTFYFKSLKNNISTSVSPYDGQSSGNGIKYSANYGTQQTTAIFQTNGGTVFDVYFVADKSTISLGDSMTYLMVIKNKTNITSFFDSLVSEMSPNLAFWGNGNRNKFTATNTLNPPLCGDSCVIRWQPIHPIGYEILPNDSLVLQYKVGLKRLFRANDVINTIQIFLGSTVISSKVISSVGTGAFPIELGDFAGQISNDIGRYHWTTHSEIGVSQFIIEYSYDGDAFQQLANIKAVGNSNTPQEYEFEDKNIHNYQGIKKVFARLKTLDIDGTFYNSPTIELAIAQNNNINLQISPNPCTASFIHIKASNSLAPFQELRVFDQTGKQIFSQEIGHNAYLYNDMLDVSAWGKGVFYLKMETSNSTTTKTIVID